MSGDSFRIKINWNLINMKRNNRILICLTLIFLLPVVLLADTVNFRTTVAKNDQTVGGDFWLDLEMAVTDGSDNTLYGLTVKIDYTNQISYQSASDWGPSGYYYQEVIDQGTYIQVGIFNFGDPSNPWTVTSACQRVVRMKFTITTATSVTIGIQDYPATVAEYWDNGNYSWTVTNDDLGNISLPISNVNIAIQRYGLLQNTPNPFGRANASTEINFVIAKTSLAEVKIYNIQGQLIKNLYRGIVNRNEELSLDWNGKDSRGNDLSSGIYLYQLLIENRLFEIKKVVIIR